MKDNSSHHCKHDFFFPHVNILQETPIVPSNILLPETLNPLMGEEDPLCLEKGIKLLKSPSP